jgi:hypothetical protein
MPDRGSKWPSIVTIPEYWRTTMSRDRLTVPSLDMMRVGILGYAGPAFYICRFPVPAPRQGGTVSLSLVGGKVEATQPMIFSADETTDVGSDTATPVSDDYGPGASRFTGRVRWVQLDIDDAAQDLDHLISPEERLRVAMARQ